MTFADYPKGHPVSEYSLSVRYEVASNSVSGYTTAVRTSDGRQIGINSDYLGDLVFKVAEPGAAILESRAIRYVVAANTSVGETTVVRASDGKPVTIQNDYLGDLVFEEWERDK